MNSGIIKKVEKMMGNGKDSSMKNDGDTSNLGNQSKLSKKEQFEVNKKQGADFEKKTVKQEKQNLDSVEEQITIRTNSGTKTRLDCVGSCKKTGEPKLVEAKSSEKAPLTKNQKIAFPEIEKSGGVVVGKGKGEFPGGTKIPPQKVKVVRPCKTGDGGCQ